MFARGCVYVRNRPQPFASDCREGKMAAVPLVSSAKVVTFGGSFHVAGVALCDIPTCFIMRRKSFCVAFTVLLHRFQKMS